MQLQKQMEVDLIRILYFSQTSDELMYMTPSLNIAFNKTWKKTRRTDTVTDVLDCSTSEEGQKLIADGSGVISLNT